MPIHVLLYDQTIDNIKIGNLTLQNNTWSAILFTVSLKDLVESDQRRKFSLDDQQIITNCINLEILNLYSEVLEKSNVMFTWNICKVEHNILFF